jgi:MFS family permease
MSSRASTDSQNEKHPLLAPLRHRDFRIFWTGLLLSSIGSQFTTVAMAWQIYELTDSPLQIGMIGLVRAVPQMFILLFGGLLADAMNRRKLMIVTQGSLFFVSGSLALLTLAAQVTPLKLYAVTVFLALFTSLEAPSRQAIVTNLVPSEDLSRALAIYSTQRQSRPSAVRRLRVWFWPLPAPPSATRSTHFLG